MRRLLIDGREAEGCLPLEMLSSTDPIQVAFCDERYVSVGQHAACREVVSATAIPSWVYPRWIARSLTSLVFDDGSNALTGRLWLHSARWTCIEVREDDQSFDGTGELDRDGSGR